MEKATVQTTINTLVSGLANLVLPTTPPNIESVTASLAAQVVGFAPPATTVQVHVAVTAVQSNSLSYTWQPDTGAAGLNPSNSATVPLVLPPTNSAVIAYVLVSDGYGGYAVGTLNFAARDQVLFSGFVADTNGNNIANAQVSVNGQVTWTSRPRVTSPLAPATRTQVLVRPIICSRCLRFGVPTGRGLVFKSPMALGRFCNWPTTRF
jgi:hypothetical protein